MILSFKMALRSIGANKMRAALTMLGIIIGVMALVVLVSLVNGATGSVTDAVADLGNSMLTVSISDNKGRPADLDTVNEWMEREEIGAVAPYLSESATASADGNSESVTLYGTTPAYYDIQGMQLAMGRFLKTSDVDNRTYACVISGEVATEIIGYADCVGQGITLNGVEFTIVGVLSDDENSLTAMVGSGSMAIYLPYTSLLRLSDSLSGEVTSFCISAPENGTMDSVEAAMNEILMERLEDDEDAFEISSQSVLEDTMSSITSVLTILLGGIAAISLVVGGIGIMNIMLVTVTERTREIGIRKAIGANRRTILSQFLMEAVLLCMMGCALGIFFSWAILQTVTTVVSSLDMTFVLDGGVVLIAVIFCFVIGIVFGLYPANKAAKMKPIDALHYGG